MPERGVGAVLDNLAGQFGTNSRQGLELFRGRAVEVDEVVGEHDEDVGAFLKGFTWLVAVVAAGLAFQLWMIFWNFNHLLCFPHFFDALAGHPRVYLYIGSEHLLDAFDILFTETAAQIPVPVVPPADGADAKHFAYGVSEYPSADAAIPVCRKYPMPVEVYRLLR